MRTSFKTAKGTELPLMNLKGKEYLTVAQRNVWFREDHPAGDIETSIAGEDKETKMVLFKADIYDCNRNHLASAHKMCTYSQFKDYVEKAETGAVGRALALCGYGTQFAGDDLYEGEHLGEGKVVDSPQPQAVIVPKSGPQPETHNKPFVTEIIYEGKTQAQTKYLKQLLINLGIEDKERVIKINNAAREQKTPMSKLSDLAKDIMNGDQHAH